MDEKPKSTANNEVQQFLEMHNEGNNLDDRCVCGGTLETITEGIGAEGARSGSRTYTRCSNNCGHTANSDPNEIASKEITGIKMDKGYTKNI